MRCSNGAPPNSHKAFTHNRGIPGTGLGLAICQRVANRYGRRIWVESTTGSGAMFAFTVLDTTIDSPTFSQDEFRGLGRDFTGTEPELIMIC